MASWPGPMPAPPEAPAAPRGDVERLVEESYRPIFRALCRLCGDADLAADLTQEAFRKAWASIATFRGECAFTTWVYRIAYTTFLNQARRPALLPLPEGLESVAAAAVEDGAADASRLRRAVLALPDDLRFAVSAHYWSDLPVREIARHEGVTTVAIRKRLRRALSLLARDLGVS